MAPRHEEVARSLAMHIEDATYPVGSRLPTEVELAESYAVSRATIRSALGTLERMRLISRRRRVGTRVEARRPTLGYARSVTTMIDLLQYSAETRRVVLDQSDIVSDADLTSRIACPVGRPWRHISMLRLDEFGEDRPLCHTDVYLDPVIADKVGDRITQPDGLITEIVERCTGRLTARVDQRIHARSLPAALAGPLRAEAGSPALEIVRSYVEVSGEVNQVTVSVHPADRYEFTVSMQRQP